MAQCFNCKKPIKAETPTEVLIRTKGGVIQGKPLCAHCRWLIRKGKLKTNV